MSPHSLKPSPRSTRLTHAPRPRPLPPRLVPHRKIRSAGSALHVLPDRPPVQGGRRPGAFPLRLRRTGCAPLALFSPPLLRVALLVLRLREGDHEGHDEGRSLPRRPRARAGTLQAAPRPRTRRGADPLRRRLAELPHPGAAPPAGALWRERFRVADDAEVSVEIDPRTLDEAKVEAFRETGFHRASFGVQDVDPAVQEAIHRIQPSAMNRRAIGWLRQAGFRSLNVDLIYGLPRQSVQSFEKTLDEVLDY
ncbi:MAG: radical SAM protein, partial [Opitutales bacterium]